MNKDNDVSVEEVPFFEERLKGVLPNQDEYVWERKVEIHTRFEQHRELVSIRDYHFIIF